MFLPKKTLVFVSLKKPTAITCHPTLISLAMIQMVQTMPLLWTRLMITIIRDFSQGLVRIDIIFWLMLLAKVISLPLYLTPLKHV